MNDNVAGFFAAIGLICMCAGLVIFIVSYIYLWDEHRLTKDRITNLQYELRYGKDASRDRTSPR